MRLRFLDMTRFLSLVTSKKGNLMLLLMSVGMQCSYAQTNADSLSVSDEEPTEVVAPKKYVDFTPEEVQLQDRYRPTENDYLFPSKWWRRMYFGFGGGLNVVTDNASSSFQPQYYGFLGYKFSPIHSLRGKFSIANYELANTGTSVGTYGFGLEYLANLSNFVNGYNPRGRVFDVSTVMGVGMIYSSKGLPKNMLPYATLGFNLNAHLSSNVDFFVEPYAGIMGSAEDVFGRKSSEKINLQYGVNAGVQFNLNERFNRYEKSDSVYRLPFVDVSIGAVASGYNGGLLHRSGVNYQAALGMWINPVLGVRVGLQGQSHHWYSGAKYLSGVKVTENKDQVLFGGRAELMINPLNISKKWRDKQGGHDFELNLLAGADLGGTMRAYVPKSPSNIAFYYGMTGALQFLYRINNPGTYIYFEPRYSTATYDITKTDNSVTSHTNHFMSLNVGTRVYMNYNAFTNRDADYFEPHWWAGVDIGGVKWQRSKTYTTGGLGVNPSFGLNVGYDWRRLASFRAQLSYQRLYDTHQASYKGMNENNVPKKGYGLWNSAYNLMDLRLSYMMNLSTLFQGYNEDRKLNLWWTVGPTVSYVFSQNDSYVEGQKNPAPDLKDIELSDHKAGNISPGMSTSLMASLRVARQMDITAEAFGQYNFIAGTNPGSRPRMNNLKYGVSLGTRYHFVPGQLKLHGNSDYKEFFFDAGLGWTSNSLSTLHNAGTAYSAALGKWFNPLLGMRLGLNGNTFKHATEIRQVNGVDLRYAKSMATVGARAELLVNPLNLFNSWREKPGGHDFDMNLLVGADLGGVAKNGYGRFYGMYYGVTSAMQFLYRINNPGTYIYLEPRYLSARYDAPYEGTNIEHKVKDNLFSMSIGVRTYMTDPSFTPKNSDEMIPGWWMGADFGGMKIQRSSIYTKPGGLGLNPSVSLSVGYDWKPLVSFRTQLSYQHYSEYTKSNYTGITAENKVVKGNGLWNRNYNILDWRFAYMLNLNNFFQGYNPDRKFNFWLTAGPAVTFITGENDKWVEEQNFMMKDVEDYKLPNNKAGNVSPALHASFMTTYKVSNKVDLTAEALGQYNFIPGTNPGTKGRMNNMKYNFALGARYHFDQDKLEDFFRGTDLQPWNKGWMLEASYGWAIPTGTGNGMNGSGSSIFVSAGHWLTNVFGLRFGFGGQQTYWGKAEYPAIVNANGQTTRGAYTLYKEQLMLGTRLELLINPLNLLSSSRRNASAAPKWDMNMSMGLTCGGLAKVSAAIGGGYVGFTAAVTGLYRVSNTTQLFVEPRIETHNYDSDENSMGFTRSYTDKMFMINVGTRVTRPVGESKESKRESDPAKMSHRGWWAGVTFGGSKMNQTKKIGAGGLGLNPSFGLTAGYDFTRLHGLRVHFAYDIHSRLRPNQKYTMLVNGRNYRYSGTMESSYHQLDARLLYMLNMSNLWTGYDKRSKFNVYWEIGPTLASVLSESHSLSDDEYVRGTDFKYVGRKYAGETSFGLSTGVLMTLSVSNQWDIMAEVLGQYHTNRGYMPEVHHIFLNGVKMNFSLGTRYNF